MVKGRLASIGVGEYAVEVHKRLDHAVDDVVALSELLGDTFEGEPLENPTEAEVRTFLKSLKRSLPADGSLVVVWSGHGLPSAGGLRLLAKDSGSDADDGLGVADVVAPCALSGANQLLFVFDTCFAGDAISASDVATQIMRETREARHVWVGVVTSCLSLETARDGLFGHRLRKILKSGPKTPELRVRWSIHNRYVRGDDVCDAVLKEWSSGAQSPDFQSRGSAWWMFPNPLYRAGAPEQVVEHLLRAARSGAPLEAPSWFTGRTAEVNTVVDWVHGRRPGLYVVTGSAGTGKSAVVGRVVSLSHPEERERLLADGHPWSHVLPEERSVSAHVHARGLTADLAADHLAGQLVEHGVLVAQEARRNASELVGEVQRAVEEGAEPPVLVVDGLDEARGEAFKIADDLLTRLAAHAVVIVSTRDMPGGEERSSLVTTLAPEGPGIDLDDPDVRRLGRADLSEYVRLRLRDVDARMDAAAVAAHLFGQDAAADQHTFLLARLVADQLSATPVDTSAEGWEEKVSHSVEDALDTDLAAVLPAPGRGTAQGPTPAALARRLLYALTWAYGAGFPEDEWLCVANAQAPEGSEVTREDLTWVLDQLGRHVVQDGESGVAVYRMAHQSLADHLRPAYRGSIEQPFSQQALSVAHALAERYRALLDAGVPANEAPYLWLYAWRHAADAGRDGLALLRSLAQESADLCPDVAMTAAAIADRFEHWGRWTDTLDLAEEAVSLLGTLAEENPSHLPSLADALDNLGTSYRQVGRRADALALTEEAVSLWRSLAEGNPAHLPNLAGTLNNLGNRLSDMGRWAEALPPAEEAVALRRTLADDNPAHLPHLATALSNLGNRLNDVGRWAEALPPAEEAVALRRTLADDNPAHLPSLAGALNNLGAHYSAVGREADGLALTEEAASLWRALAEDNPAHLPDLALALNNLGSNYSAVGREADGLALTEEAVALRRTLAEDNPAHLPDLALALNNLGVSYSDVGRRAEALHPTEEAVRLYRTLADDNPAHLPHLAAALSNLGNRLSDVGRRLEGLPPTEEAVALYRTLADDNPAHLPHLAGALNNLGNHYSDLGRKVEALPPAEEAVLLYRTLAEHNPAHLPNLAGALSNLGTNYGSLGRPDDALIPIEESVALYRTLAEHNPAHLPNLAGTLNNLGTRYDVMGRPAEAMAAAQEAVTLYNRLAADNSAHLPHLATALDNLGAAYNGAERWAEALSPSEEAVRLRRTLADDNPAHLPDLAAALNNLGKRLSDVGRWAEALPPAEEAVRLYRTLAEDDPANLLELATALNNLTRQYVAVGSSAEPLWKDVLGKATPDAAAFLLLSRSYEARQGDPSAIPWLVEAAHRMASTAAHADLHGLLHAEGRRHRTAAPEAFDEAWRRLTGENPPAWLTVDPDLLALAAGWIATKTYPAERDHLAAHLELLGPEADVAVDEALLGLREEAAQRYRALRQAAQTNGVDAAYRPLLSAFLATQFALSDPREQRVLLERQRDDLLDDLVAEFLSVGAADPDQARLFQQAQWLLQLAELNADEPVLDALDDPSLFPDLLRSTARRPDTTALESTAHLALTAATDDRLTAEAAFHLALAAAIDGDQDHADTLLAAAVEHACDNVPSWIDDLADIAGHHPAALTLIPRLTAHLPAGSPKEHDDPALPD